jgi:hypothetical protein
MPRLSATQALLVSVVFLATASTSAQLNYPGASQQSGKAQCNGLVGVWAGPQFTIDLGRDGTTVVNGVRYRYTADAKVITLVGSDGIFRYPYQLQGDVLNLLINGAVQSFRCAAQGAQAPSPQGGGGGGMSESLMLSSAWCTFSYNKISGYSNTTRLVFSPNGTYSKGGRGEGYSSGYGGTMASQHNTGGGGRWKVVNGELYIGDVVPQPVRAVVKRNSNGYPVVVVNGVEYSQCK